MCPVCWRMVYLGKACFVREGEGAEQESSMFESHTDCCPCCNLFVPGTQKLLGHIAAHILHDSSLQYSLEPCGLCSLPSPSCKFFSCKDWGGIQVDLKKSECPHLARFSYAKAKEPTEHSPSSNVPIKCPCCPNTASAVWKYNIAAHYEKNIPAFQFHSNIASPHSKMTHWRISGIIEFQQAGKQQLPSDKSNKKANAGVVWRTQQLPCFTVSYIILLSVTGLLNFSSI